MGTDSADQQLRIACAEALGWTHVENANTMAIGGIWRGYPPTRAIIGKKALLPDPISSFDDAFQLVKKARQEGWRVTIKDETFPGPGWVVEFRKRVEVGGLLNSGTDSDLRRAIAVAFLRLMGSEFVSAIGEQHPATSGDVAYNG